MKNIWQSLTQTEAAVSCWHSMV